eukprot:8356242-Alexandrium_andersonii.AAC.1
MQREIEGSPICPGPTWAIADGCALQDRHPPSAPGRPIAWPPPSPRPQGPGLRWPGAQGPAP